MKDFTGVKASMNMTYLNHIFTFSGLSLFYLFIKYSSTSRRSTLWVHMQYSLVLSHSAIVHPN